MLRGDSDFVVVVEVKAPRSKYTARGRSRALLLGIKQLRSPLNNSTNRVGLSVLFGTVYGRKLRRTLLLLLRRVCVCCCCVKSGFGSKEVTPAH